jgi:hypothetical protein
VRVNERSSRSTGEGSPAESRGGIQARTFPPTVMSWSASASPGPTSSTRSVRCSPFIRTSTTSSGPGVSSPGPRSITS